MSGDSDLYTATLPVDVEELILDRTLRWSPKIEGNRRVMTDDEFRKALNLAWANNNKRRFRTGQRRGIGGGRPGGALVVSTSGLS